MESVPPTPEGGEAAPRPRGREAVRTAILEAAADLMAKHGASASLRDIASAAGVNLGLIHRHFGNKADLRREVLAYLGELQRERLDASAGSVGELFAAVQEDDRNWRILVRAMMSGEKMVDVSNRFPVTDRVYQLAMDAAGPDADEDDVRFKVGRLVATALGWLILEPFIIESVGIREPAEKVRQRLVQERASDLGLAD